MKKTLDGNVQFLFVDPHFVAGNAANDAAFTSAANEGAASTDADRKGNHAAAIAENFVRWMNLDGFSASSFYNLLFPMV